MAQLFYEIDNNIIFQHLKECVKGYKKKEENEKQREIMQDMEEIFKWIGRNINDERKHPTFPCINVETASEAGKFVEIQKIYNEQFTIDGYAYQISKISPDFTPIVQPLKSYWNNRKVDKQTLLTFWKLITEHHPSLDTLLPSKLTNLLELFKQFHSKGISFASLDDTFLFPTDDGCLMPKRQIYLIEKKEHDLLVRNSEELHILHEEFVPFAHNFGFKQLEFKKELANTMKLEMSDRLDEFKERLSWAEFHTGLFLMCEAAAKRKEITISILDSITLWECSNLTIHIGTGSAIAAIEKAKFMRKLFHGQGKADENVEIQFIFCKDKYFTNSISGLLRKALGIRDFDKDVLTKFLELPKQKMVEYIEKKTKRSLKLKMMEPGQALLPIHEKWIKKDIYSILEDNELVVVEVGDAKIYGKIHSLESGTPGSNTAVYKVVVATQPLSIISLSILYIYKLFNESEMNGNEWLNEESNEMEMAIISRTNQPPAGNLPKGERKENAGEGNAKERNKWTAEEKKEEIRKMWKEFMLKEPTDQEKNQLIKRIKLSIHPDKNFENTEAAEEVFKWFLNFLEGKDDNGTANFRGNANYAPAYGANKPYGGNPHRNKGFGNNNQGWYYRDHYYSSGFRYYNEESKKNRKQRIAKLQKEEEAKLELEMQLLDKSILMVEQAPMLGYSVVIVVERIIIQILLILNYKNGEIPTANPPTIQQLLRYLPFGLATRLRNLKPGWENKLAALQLVFLFSFHSTHQLIIFSSNCYTVDHYDAIFCCELAKQLATFLKAYY